MDNKHFDLKGLRALDLLLRESLVEKRRIYL